MTEQEFRNFLSVGLCVQGLCGVKGEAVAYLYNGVRAPDINTVWTDKTTQPCATIRSYNGGESLILGLCAGEVTYQDNIAGGTYTMPAPYSQFILEEGKWAYHMSNDEDHEVMRATHEVIWSNHDIVEYNALQESKGVILAASEPIPVYE